MTGGNRPRVGLRGRLPAAARCPALAAAVAGVASACGSESAPRIVDAWLVDAPRTCSDLDLEQDRCDMLVERARSYAEEVGGPIAGWTLHEAIAMDAAGSPRLYDSGAGNAWVALGTAPRAGNHKLNATSLHHRADEVRDVEFNSRVA